MIEAMLRLPPFTRALTVNALFATLAFGASAPASASSFSGFDRNHVASNTVPHAHRRHATRRFIPDPDPLAYRPYDGGGNVFDYSARVQEANYGSRLTVISGVCPSACTMKLGSKCLRRARCNFLIP